MSKAACTYSSRSVDEGRRERGVFVCMLASVSCASAWVRVQGRWIVSHHLWLTKASAIKAAHFNTLSYGKNTQMDAHSWLRTHTRPISHSLGFLFGFFFVSAFFCSFMDTYMFALFARKKKPHTHTVTYTSTADELRADSTICGVGSGTRRQNKRNQSVPAQYSMSLTS